MAFIRFLLCTLLLAAAFLSARADDILFFGNSFTYGATEPIIEKNGGVPKLLQEIAAAKGRHVQTTAITAGGKDLSYFLTLPATDQALQKSWTWIVLQDYSLRPTHVGNVPQFLRDGEVFSERLARTSPNTGIVLFETWARPAGAFYKTRAFSGPEEMMSDLHRSYASLRDDLAKNPNRPAKVALVGTAFAREAAEYPTIDLNAADHHHADAEGYYLAALVIYETIYHDTAKGAPNQFFNGQITIPAADAAKLQQVADEVALDATATTAQR
jgi:hypothetical protein